MTLNPQYGTLTTAGNGILTAALLTGINIKRTVGGSSFIDTTDSAANIIAALNGMPAGASWNARYWNSSNFTVTLAGGTGVTLDGATEFINSASIADLLITVTGKTTVTVTVLTVVSSSI